MHFVQSRKEEESKESSESERGSGSVSEGCKTSVGKGCRADLEKLDVGLGPCSISKPTSKLNIEAERPPAHKGSREPRW